MSGKYTLPGVLGSGLTSGRPAASAVAAGALYAETDGLVYQSDGVSTWTAWGPTSLANPMTTKGDIILGDTSGVPTRLAAGTSTYVLTSNGAGAFPSWQAPGGGGGGSDLVQTNSGAGSVYVPGLRGSPDAKPASPSSYDDEFDSLSGWSTLGTLDTSSVADFPSHWHAKRTEGSSSIDGIYKAAPPPPFTVTARLRAATLVSGHQATGIFLHDGTKVASIDLDYAAPSGLFANDLRKWSNRVTWSASVGGDGPLVGTGDKWYQVPLFQRVVVTSVSSIAAYYSVDGYIWVGPQWSGQSTGLSAVTYVGLGISDPISGFTVEAVWDWIRFT